MSAPWMLVLLLFNAGGYSHFESMQSVGGFYTQDACDAAARIIVATSNSHEGEIGGGSVTAYALCLPTGLKPQEPSP